MAADQLNKRSKVSNVIRHTSYELQKTKKKKVSHYDINTRSNISLEWDDKKAQVVPKKEQIGIALRELTPYLPDVSSSQNALGDVFSAPRELFELDNVSNLLSYELWQTHLSVQEREFLMQFLPEGSDPNKTVYELLSGKDFYFGNPFEKWGASICSGDCHPDAILRQEQCNKANKIAYYSELHKYHTKMIGSLQSWKEKWASCVNPENDFMQKIQRSKKDFHKSGSSHENGVVLYGSKDNFGASSDSCSWDADDKSYSSDNPDLIKTTDGETTTRVSRRDLQNKCYDSSGGLRSGTGRSRKGDKSQRLNVECGDGAKYMSYIKVSKEQHQRVKNSMKNSNTSIQPRSLNHVLGNLDSFCVQPYEVFEEEEKQKLHQHWLNLAKKDLPKGFENWNVWRSAKWQLTKSLRKEFEDKWKLNESNNATLEKDYQQEEEEKEQPFDHEEQSDEATNDEILIAQKEDNEEDVNTENHERAMQVENSGASSQNQHLTNFCPMAIDANDGVLIESSAFPSNISEYPEHLNHSDVTVGEQFPLPSSATEMWPSVSLPNTYYHHQPTPVVSTHGFTSIGELSSSLIRQNQSILESEMHQKDPLRSSYLHRRSDGGDSFFNPYANQDRNELLLHSLFKDPASSYLHEQKLSRLGFHSSGGSDSIMGPTPTQFPRSSSLNSSLQLDSRHKRLGLGVGDVYMHQNNLQENIFSIPRQEHLLPINNHVHDWAGNSVVNMSIPMPTPTPTPTLTHHHHHHNRVIESGQVSSQGWFHEDEVAVRDQWSGGVVPNQVADESLFSVLSQCNGLQQHSGVRFGSTGVTEQFIPSTSYVGVGRGLVMPPPTTTAAVPPRVVAARGTGVGYVSGNDGQSGSRSNALAWVTLPTLPRALHDARSWNDDAL